MFYAEFMDYLKAQGCELILLHAVKKAEDYTRSKTFRWDLSLSLALLAGVQDKGLVEWRLSGSLLRGGIGPCWWEDPQPTMVARLVQMDRVHISLDVSDETWEDHDALGEGGWPVLDLIRPVEEDWLPFLKGKDRTTTWTFSRGLGRKEACEALRAGMACTGEDLELLSIAQVPEQLVDGAREVLTKKNGAFDTWCHLMREEESGERRQRILLGFADV